VVVVVMACASCGDLNLAKDSSHCFCILSWSEKGKKSKPSLIFRHQNENNKTKNLGLYTQIYAASLGFNHSLLFFPSIITSVNPSNYHYRHIFSILSSL
jgi:hypothetical protein